MERQCWVNALYFRRECLDIIGIPSEANADILKEKVSTSVVSFVVIPLQSKLTPAIKSAKKKLNHSFVRFTKNKDCHQVWSVKRDLQKIKMEIFNLSGKSKLFINGSLCPFYKVLWSKRKRLHSLGKIFSFYISGYTTKTKVSRNSFPLSITYVDDFPRYFPVIDLSPLEGSK